MFIIILNSLWLGILTSINPCSFGSNIAMISYLLNNNPKKSIILSLLYTLGRIFFYTVIGLILSLMINKIGITSMFLQKQGNIFLGIILIIIGLLILDLIKFNVFFSFFNNETTANIKNKLSSGSYLGTFLLGVLFASALCPVSAGLFFGNLIQNKGNIFSLIFYGLGTGIPVFIISFILSFMTNKIASFYKKISLFEKYSTRITGLIFVCVGLYSIFVNV